MDRNIRIARRLVKIAKQLVGATLMINVDFSGDETLLKTWCDSRQSFTFSSDNGADDRIFTVSTPVGNVKIQSDIVFEERTVVYNVLCDAYTSERCPTMENAIDGLRDAIYALIEAKLAGTADLFRKSLKGICDNVVVEKYGLTGTFNKYPGIKICLTFNDGDDFQNGIKWGYDVNGAVTDYSYTTIEKAMDALVEKAKQIDQTGIMTI